MLERAKADKRTRGSIFTNSSPQEVQSLQKRSRGTLVCFFLQLFLSKKEKVGHINIHLSFYRTLVKESITHKQKFTPEVINSGVKIKTIFNSYFLRAIAAFAFAAIFSAVKP